MTVFDEDSRPRREAAETLASVGRSHRTRVGLACANLVCAVAAVALAGCGFGNGPGSLMVDPGHYSVMHCKDLIDQRNALITREQELQKLQDMASQGTGGAFIGNMAYRADYETALTEQKLVEREAREKNCEISHVYQSDQTVR